jgi:hypothetical protein
MKRSRLGGSLRGRRRGELLLVEVMREAKLFAVLQESPFWVSIPLCGTHASTAGVPLAAAELRDCRLR